ncbi:YoaK family protein [Hyalangium rubrum]|uniref:YoaK family protein n=1 Tax=Hyalangium rubrum TaxID=3103134 RepID=A0ABU5H3J8_9BACT|nr:YoaK family protein [Hyalangium sp. s54d21]MDY7228038.1 YoaK family protein [Hyalangium sp. s54d21]
MTPPAPTSAPPLIWLALLLSVTTGLVDAISVLGLGKVFTANMTGNVVFLGFAVAGTPGFHFAPYLAAMSFFLAGAVIAGQIARAQRGRPLRRWLLLAAMMEALLLWLAAIIATGFDIASQSPGPSLYAIIALTALTMGFRNATVRQLKIPEVTTTVLTLTLTGLAADSTLAGGTNPNWARRLGSVAAIFAGAVIGATLVLHVGLVAPLILAGVLVLAGTAVCARHPAAAQLIS